MKLPMAPVDRPQHPPPPDPQRVSKAFSVPTTTALRLCQGQTESEHVLYFLMVRLQHSIHGVAEWQGWMACYLALFLLHSTNTFPPSKLLSSKQFCMVLSTVGADGTPQLLQPMASRSWSPRSPQSWRRRCLRVLRSCPPSPSPRRSRVCPLEALAR